MAFTSRASGAKKKATEEVGHDDFQANVLQSELPVLVDFYADWCGPCKKVAPILEELAAEYAGRVRIVKVDVDANQQLASMLRISSLPTFLLIKDGDIVDQAVGVQPRKRFVEMLDSVAGSGAGVERWDPSRLHLAIESGIATAVDLRSSFDFQRARLPGAINAPIDDEESSPADTLTSEDTRYVFYDRAGDSAAEVARAAAAKGHEVAVLDGGMLAWEAEMLPVEKGAAR